MSAKPVRIAPSILSADFGRLGADVAAVSEAGADLIHVDVMDGRFVPNLTIGPPVVEALRRATQLPLDVHLMIVEPDKYVPDFAKAGADMITVHEEACPHLHRSIQLIRQLGKSPGVALNPHTPASTLKYVIDDIDLVLVMTVNPGFGGQSLIEAVLEKCAEVRAMSKRVAIEVDGGVKVETIEKFASAGADTYVSGSGVFNTKDWRASMAKMREIATAHLK
jgi:ribulose-phosphate 3-epimerase